jgi:hypothetical protein
VKVDQGVFPFPSTDIFYSSIHIEENESMQ